MYSMYLMFSTYRVRVSGCLTVCGCSNTRTLKKLTHTICPDLRSFFLSGFTPHFVQFSQQVCKIYTQKQWIILKEQTEMVQVITCMSHMSMHPPPFFFFLEYTPCFPTNNNGFLKKTLLQILPYFSTPPGSSLIRTALAGTISLKIPSVPACFNFHTWHLFTSFTLRFHIYSFMSKM